MFEDGLRVCPVEGKIQITLPSRERRYSNIWPGSIVIKKKNYSRKEYKMSMKHNRIINIKSRFDIKISHTIDKDC